MSSTLKIFPASLGTDWGRILTEQNIKSILGYLQTKSLSNTFKYTNAVIDGFDVINYGDSNGAISLSTGDAVFEGYQVKTLENVYTNIYYPGFNTYSSGTYYICLHLKFTTGDGGISDFVVTEDYKDFANNSQYPDYTASTNIPVGTSPINGDDDSPFIIVKEGNSDWSDGIPDNMGATTIEDGYVYKYLQLYKVILENSVSTVDSSYVVDLRHRYFMPIHDLTIGYMNDELTHYFGMDAPDMNNEEVREMDWRYKYVLSDQGNLKSLEELLFNYISFIDSQVRGYNSELNNGSDRVNGIKLGLISNDSVTASQNPLSRGFRDVFDNTTDNANKYGDCLSIQNTTDPKNSIVGRLTYDKYVGESDSNKVSANYINDFIVQPDNNNSVSTYNTNSRFGFGWLVTLNNDSKVDYKFLPVADDDKPGLIQINKSFIGDDSNPSSSDIFSFATVNPNVDTSIAFNQLESHAARYSISEINSITVPRNNTVLNITSQNNKLSQPIFSFTGNENDGIISFVLNNANPVNTAYSLKYNSSYTQSSGEYVINQNLLQTSDVVFNSVTVNGNNGISTNYISPVSGSTVSLSGDLVVSGSLTAQRVYNAVYNDVAELFKKSDIKEHFEPGDIICMNKEGTGYTKSTEIGERKVVGVYSNTYGLLLGGEKDRSEEENLQDYIPVGISGRVSVKVKGKLHVGDTIISSNIPGVGKFGSTFGCIIGKSLENKETDDIGLVKIMIMLG